MKYSVCEGGDTTGCKEKEIVRFCGYTIGTNV